MRKSVGDRVSPDRARGAQEWFDLERVARVEVSSEEEARPIEAALVEDDEVTGWRAARPGRQTLRLLFDEPLRLSRINLLFRECELARTQEFVLRWSPDGGESFREIVRQRYNFSPAGATRETENYDVVLDGVTAIELIITPDVDGGDARASLARLRLG